MSTAQHLDIDWTACQGHGLCADFLPEHIVLDEWGYPLVDGAPVPAGTVRRARRAAADCPVLALALVPGRAGRGEDGEVSRPRPRGRRRA